MAILNKARSFAQNHGLDLVEALVGIYVVVIGALRTLMAVKMATTGAPEWLTKLWADPIKADQLLFGIGLLLVFLVLIERNKERHELAVVGIAGMVLSGMGNFRTLGWEIVAFTQVLVVVFGAAVVYLNRAPFVTLANAATGIVTDHLPTMPWTQAEAAGD